MAKLDVITPEIDDGSGFRLRQKDLQILKLTLSAVRACQEGRCPLGMTAKWYEAFQDALARAAEDDGLDPTTLDVRLQGSSVKFFSSPYKSLPLTPVEISNQYYDERRIHPTSLTIGEITDRLAKWWVDDGQPPQRRPFDSMYLLRIARKPSDYDIQISSDEIEKRCKNRLPPGLDVTKLRFAKPTYNFIEKSLVQEAFPHLWLFCCRYTEELNRDVTIAAFASSGPPVAPGDPAKSSHFKPTDWVIQLKRSSPTPTGIR